MLKKKLTAIITLIAILVTSMSFSITAIADNTQPTVTDLKVNKVQDINLKSIATNVEGIDNKCTDITVENGPRSYDYYYKFTLDKPSFVAFDFFANICTSNYAGDVFVYIGNSLTTCTTQIWKEWTHGISGSYGHILEAGTYYLKAVVQINEAKTSTLGNPLIKDDKNLGITLYAQETSRSTGDIGLTKDTAIVTNNLKGQGLMSKAVRTQWFKFTIDSKCDVTFDTLLTPPENWAKCTNAWVSLIDKDGKEIGEYVGGKHESSRYWPKDVEQLTGTYEGLAAGTYYVKVEVGEGGAVKVNLDITAKDKYAPNAPKAINYKSGNKYVKGNAEKGSTVYVKYNGKTTKAKTDEYGVYKVNTAVLKVGKNVQIWANDAEGNKSAVTKVTIKNRQIAKPKVKTYKVNTKLVKGTAKKGTTVHVTYAGKTYKKKLTGTSYSVKLNKKLTKGTAIKVKVVDSYGNYSKTVTVKVK